MSRPAKCISINDARKLQKKWKNTRGKLFKDKEKYDDICEVWYSLDELQEYLNYVRDLSAEQGVENPGISIWLGAEDKDGKKDGLGTVFLSATKGTSATESNIQQNDDETSEAMMYSTSSNYETNESIDAFNHGSGKYPPADY